MSLGSLNNKLLTIEKRKEAERIIAETTKGLQKTEERQIKQMQEKAQANYFAQGEENTRYRFKLNTSKYPQQIMQGLRDEQNNIIRKSEQMVNIASRYYVKL